MTNAIGSSWGGFKLRTTVEERARDAVVKAAQEWTKVFDTGNFELAIDMGLRAAVMNLNSLTGESSSDDHAGADTTVSHTTASTPSEPVVSVASDGADQQSGVNSTTGKFKVGDRVHCKDKDYDEDGTIIQVDPYDTLCYYVDLDEGDTGWFYPNEVTPLEDDDNVNSPAHYKIPGMDIEVIDIIHAYGFDYDHGNVLKYFLRAGRKTNEVEDLKKCRFYIDEVIKSVEAQQ